MQDFSQYQCFIDPFGNKSSPQNGFLCLQFYCSLIGCLKQALKSDWLFCFSVPFSLAGEMERFTAKNSAIWE